MFKCDSRVSVCVLCRCVGDGAGGATQVQTGREVCHHLEKQDPERWAPCVTRISPDNSLKSCDHLRASCISLSPSLPPSLPPSSASDTSRLEAGVMASIDALQLLLAIGSPGDSQHSLQLGPGRGSHQTSPRPALLLPGRGDRGGGAFAGVLGTTEEDDGGLRREQQQVEGLLGHERRPAQDWVSHCKGSPDVLMVARVVMCVCVCVCVCLCRR